MFLTLLCSLSNHHWFELAFLISGDTSVSRWIKMRLTEIWFHYHCLFSHCQWLNMLSNFDKIQLIVRMHTWTYSPLTRTALVCKNYWTTGLIMCSVLNTCDILIHPVFICVLKISAAIALRHSCFVINCKQHIKVKAFFLSIILFYAPQIDL